MNEITWVLGGALALLLGTFIIFLIRLSSGLSVVQATLASVQIILGDFIKANTNAHKDIWNEVNNTRESVARIKGRMNGNVKK